MHRSDAEILGLKALTWLAGDEAALLRFLAGSGLERDDLHARASEPELLAAVLDFLLAEDALLAAFCAEEGIGPAMVHKARRQLPGGTGEA